MNRIFACVLLVLPALVSAQDEKPKQDPPKQDDLDKRTKQKQGEMTKIRALEFKNGVKVGVYSKDELIEFLKKEMEKEAPREKVVRYQKAYQHFQLVPKEFDLYEATIDLLGSSIAGFYHPKTKEMRLVRAADGEGDPAEKLFEQQFSVTMEDITLVHELCHAAQDQNFELTTLPMDDETNDDMVAALKGLVEGDASIVGWKYCFKDNFDMYIGPTNAQYKSGMLPGKGADLPAYMRKTLTFPYGYGTEFVLAVWRAQKEDWSAVSKMFEDPPSSTEQILHPKKYYQDRDNPTVVTLDGIGKIVGDSWKEQINNVHGEYVIRILLGEFKAQRAREIDKIAAGWDGDRFHTFESGDKLMTVWYTTWDSEDDAREFFEGYGKAIEAKYEKPAKDAADQKCVFDAGKAGKVLIERRGVDVLVIDGADAALLEKANAIWSSAKKAELKKVERQKMTHGCPKHATEQSTKAEKCRVCGEVMKPKEEPKKDY
jgi:hypothetical protein